MVKLQLLHQRCVILSKKNTCKSICALPNYHPHLISALLTNIPPWICSSPHRRNPQCHFVGFCPSCDWTHPRCSVPFHLCPRLLLFDRLNFRHPMKILRKTVTRISPYRACTWPLVSNLKGYSPGFAYQLEKCHNRRSHGCSLSNRSPQPQTDTAPT